MLLRSSGVRSAWPVEGFVDYSDCRSAGLEEPGFLVLSVDAKNDPRVPKVQSFWPA